MFLLGFRRKMTALALCKSIESAIQWFQIHHRITFATIQNPAVYLSGARVSIFSTLIPRLILTRTVWSVVVGHVVLAIHLVHSLETNRTGSMSRQILVLSEHNLFTLKGIGT